MGLFSLPFDSPLHVHRQPPETLDTLTFSLTCTSPELPYIPVLTPHTPA